MAYDDGDITERERLAAEHQKELGSSAASNTKNQFNQLIENYDFSDRQNKQLADIEKQQNSRKTEADRFQANRQLQNAATGVLAAFGNGMNSSGTSNMIDMLRDRTDYDNVNYWTQHQQNQDAVENAYQESVNQNRVNKNDAAINAEYALRGLEQDMSANLNNINPNLYEAPGTGSSDFGSSGFADSNKVAENYAQLSGYLMPDNSRTEAQRQVPPDQVKRNDYYGTLINNYNAGRNYK